MFKISIFILSILIGNMAFGQDMLIEQIAGKEIVRKAFNAEKEQISKQVFKVEELQTSGSELTVELQVKLFDEDGKLVENYFTRYTCESGKSDVLVTVFPFARKDDAEYVVEASSPGFKRLYDFESGDNTLEDLSMEMSIKSGLLGFFGSKNKVTLSKRRVNKTASGFDLQSQLTMEAYLWGIKVKTIRYAITEKLDNNRTLLSQNFTAKDGSSFTMNY